LPAFKKRLFAIVFSKRDWNKLPCSMESPVTAQQAFAQVNIKVI